MQPYETLPFAGLTGSGTRTARDTEMPEWYRNRAGVEQFDDLPTLTGVVRELPKAVTRELAYYDQQRDEYVTSGEHVALVNPDWLGDGLDDAPKADAMWHPPTDSYTPVNPVDVYGPMTAMAHQRDWHEAYGLVTLFRNGGEAHLEVFFPDLTASASVGPDAVFGVASGYDHYGSTRTYAIPNAAVPDRGIVLRDLGEKRARRHVGTAATDAAAWWDETFDELDAATDVILNVIADAMGYEFPFPTEPVTPADVFVALGFGDTQVEPLVESYRDFITDHPDHRHTAWAVYMAISEWLDLEYGGKETGSTMADHVARANRVLYRAPDVETAALDAAAERLRTDGTLADLGAQLDRIEERKNSLADARESVVSLRQRLKAVLEAETDDDGDEPEAAEA